MDASESPDEPNPAIAIVLPILSILSILFNVSIAVCCFYGIWLGFKASVLWGFVTVVTFPFLAVLGFAEIALGWNFFSPLWPFTAAALLGLSRNLSGFLILMVSKLIGSFVAHRRSPYY